MRLTCPACGCHGDAECFVDGDDQKKAGAALAALPESVQRLAFRYLGLFRKPDGSRAMTGSRALRLAEELRGLVLDPEIQWDGKRILANRAEHWKQALEVLFERDAQGKLKRPLANHNLLRVVAYDVADKAGEQALKAKEHACTSRRPEPRPTACSEEQGPRRADAGVVLQRSAEMARAWRERQGGGDGE